MGEEQQDTFRLTILAGDMQRRVSVGTVLG